MVRDLLAAGTDEVRVLSRDEAKQDDMRRAFGDGRLRFFLGDVRDIDSVREAAHGVNNIFHAAALKQVPSCEFFPLQAVQTNVLGSNNVMNAAASVGVKSVVFLSTDKAVYPINAMGISKAMMEKVAQAFARNNPDSETTVSITRYGNVMYSRGSVIPVFVDQVKKNKAMTVTDPTMTRFLMSLDESVSLVNYAFDNAEIKFIGSRHSEKLFESLLGRGEKARSEDMGDYFRVPLDARSLEYELFFDEGTGEATEIEDYNSHNTERLGIDQVKALLMELPEMRAEIAAPARR